MHRHKLRLVYCEWWRSGSAGAIVGPVVRFAAGGVRNPESTSGGA